MRSSYNTQLRGAAAYSNTESRTAVYEMLDWMYAQGKVSCEWRRLDTGTTEADPVDWLISPNYWLGLRSRQYLCPQILGVYYCRPVFYELPSQLITDTFTA